MTGAPSLTVVIPVRNAASLIAGCVRPILDQCEPGDRVLVVDDASSDDTARIAAAAGAEVLTRSCSGGPYAARNDGWQATDHPYVAFTDARCVVRPGWLARLREAAADGPDLIFSDIVVRSGARLAERTAARRQHLLARHYAVDPYFLPYFPTANLTVKREALAAVGGFDVMPSGGDADLCWRVQLAGFDRVIALDEPLMDWRPRETVREFLEQWAKYGQSNAILRTAYADRGAPLEPPLGSLRAVARHARQTGRRLKRHPRSEWVEVAVDGMANTAHEIAYGRTLRRLQRDGSARG